MSKTAKNDKKPGIKNKKYRKTSKNVEKPIKNRQKYRKPVKKQ